MRSCFTVFDSIFPGANQQRVFGGKTAGTGTENNHGNRGLSVKAYGKAVRFHCPFQKRKLCWPRRSFRTRICGGLCMPCIGAVFLHFCCGNRLAKTSPPVCNESIYPPSLLIPQKTPCVKKPGAPSPGIPLPGFSGTKGRKSKRNQRK